MSLLPDKLAQTKKDVAITRQIGSPYVERMSGSDRKDDTILINVDYTISVSHCQPVNHQQMSSTDFHFPLLVTIIAGFTNHFPITNYFPFNKTIKIKK